MERTPNKSQYTKLILERKILPPLQPGRKLATFDHVSSALSTSYPSSPDRVGGGDNRPITDLKTVHSFSLAAQFLTAGCIFNRGKDIMKDMYVPNEKD